MRRIIKLITTFALLSGTCAAGEAAPQRCQGAISSCFRIDGSLSMLTNVGFVLDIEGSRNFVMSRHPPPRTIAEIIGLDLSAKIDATYNVCPMRHDTNQLGHRHIYCIESFENLVVRPSSSAKPSLCQTHTCKK
ncbi:MAG: hypothetical protein AB7E79_08455 [Rhodospirillaceae bacterium]